MALGEFMCTAKGQGLCIVLFVVGVVLMVAIEIFDQKWG